MVVTITFDKAVEDNILRYHPLKGCIMADYLTAGKIPYEELVEIIYNAHKHVPQITLTIAESIDRFRQMILRWIVPKLDYLYTTILYLCRHIIVLSESYEGVNIGPLKDGQLLFSELQRITGLCDPSMNTTQCAGEYNAILKSAGKRDALAYFMGKVKYGQRRINVTKQELELVAVLGNYISGIVAKTMELKQQGKLAPADIESHKRYRTAFKKDNIGEPEDDGDNPVNLLLHASVIWCKGITRLSPSTVGLNPSVLDFRNIPSEVAQEVSKIVFMSDVNDILTRTLVETNYFPNAGKFAQVIGSIPRMTLTRPGMERRNLDALDAVMRGEPTVEVGMEIDIGDPDPKKPAKRVSPEDKKAGTDKSNMGAFLVVAAAVALYAYAA